MHVNRESEVLQREIVVRLLSGVLRGCEFSLSTGRTLFLVIDDSEICHQQQSDLLPDNTLYIPGESSSHNFEIIVPATDDEPVKLRQILEREAQERTILANEVITVDSLSFAWREPEGVFSDEIILNSNVPDKEDSDEITIQPENNKSSLLKYLVAGCMLVSAFFAGYYWLTGTQRQVSDIATLLQHDQLNYQILMGKDRLVYIYAKDHKMADWAAQTLIKNSSMHKARIVTRAGEQERVSRWLHREWPHVKFHRVKIDDPQHPIVELSAERGRLKPEEREKLTAALKQILPCATSVTLTALSDKEVRTLAAQGLKKIAVIYSEVINKDSVTFTLQGAISDAELVRIKDFIDYYHQIWGGDYIRFTLDIKDDWLKGRSYKYGAEGYIKSSSRHWYFPGKITTE